MKKTNRNLYILYMVFSMALITANCIATKVFNTGLTLNGAPVVLTVGVICYPLTFLVTDIIGEMWGKKEANIAVLGGFICQVISTLIIIIARFLPANDEATQDAYITLMGQNWVFVVASLTAYTASQKWDVFVFHKIRSAWIERNGTTKGGKWIWNNVGTITSQLIDSILYATVAFGIGFGWLADSNMHAALFNMILAQWLFKCVLALLDTPFFYFFTRHSEEYRSMECNGDCYQCHNCATTD